MDEASDVAGETHSSTIGSPSARKILSVEISRGRIPFAEMEKGECHDIGFTYPGAAAPSLSHCGFSLDTREVTLLLGDNGAGKSTAIRLLTGQLAGFSGCYLVEGEPVSMLRGEVLATMPWGYSPDQPVLDPYLTGREVLDFVRRRGLEEAEFEVRLADLRKTLALGEWLEDGLCREYSKGMQKKVGLAIAFLGKLSYAFLDEPFDGLDPITAHGLKALILRRKSEGAGMLLSSHQLDSAGKLADRILFMKQGRILHAGSMQSLLDRWPHLGSLEEIFLEIYSAHSG